MSEVPEIRQRHSCYYFFFAMKKFFYGFYWGSTNFFFLIFLVLAFKTINTQMLFLSVFLKTQKKTLLTAKNGQNCVFDSHKLVFGVFSKILTKRTFVHLLFLKLNQSRNTKKIFVWGDFFKNLKRTFQGVQNGTF